MNPALTHCIPQEPTNRGALLLIVFDNVSCESRKPTNREAEKEALEKSLETAKAEARKILGVFVMPPQS
jgi:hypothetical protein